MQHSRVESFKQHHPEEFKFLSENYSKKPFFESLWNQLHKYGRLSEKQLSCITNNISKPKTSKYKPSFSSGDRVEIKNWIAKQLEEEAGLPFFFRNLIVEAHHGESAKAVRLSVRFDHTVASTCHVCGRGLDDPRSMAIGIGPTCAKRMGMEQLSNVTANLALKLIKMEADKIGVVGPVWIPKSQIALRGTEDVSEEDFLDMMGVLGEFGNSRK